MARASSPQPGASGRTCLACCINTGHRERSFMYGSGLMDSTTSTAAHHSWVGCSLPLWDPACQWLPCMTHQGKVPSALVTYHARTAGELQSMQLHHGAAIFPIWGIMVLGGQAQIACSPSADTLIIPARRFA